MNDMTDAQALLARLLRAPLDMEAQQAFLAALPSYVEMAPFVDFVLRRVLARDHQHVFWGDRMLTLDKSAGFLDDPAFTQAWGQVRGAHPYDQYDAEQSIAWRLHTLVWAAREALSLPAGDFVECGVFQGDMSFVVYHAAGLAGSGRALHLFDSFDGLDPLQVSPGEYAFSTNYFEAANRYYQRPGLYEGVVERFADLPEVRIHRGFLPDALAGRAPDSIAWLHIDLNSAMAEVGVLEALFDRVAPGGRIILDDYGWRALKTQKVAEDTFFAERGYQVLELPTGQGLVIKRPSQPQNS